MTDPFITKSEQTTLFIEIGTSSQSVSLTIDGEDSDVLSQAVTEDGWKAFLRAFFEELDVPSRGSWKPSESFRSKHLGITDEEELRFQRRYEDAYHTLAEDESERVVARFTPGSVSVDLRQAAPDDIHSDRREELDAWVQTALGETYEWVDGVFTVADVETDLQYVNGRKTSRRVFMLEYDDGTVNCLGVKPRGFFPRINC